MSDEQHVFAKTARSAKRAEVGLRRQKAAELLLSRRPQYEIAQELGVSPQTVSADVRAVRQQWAKEAADSYGQFIAEALATLDADERRLREKMNHEASCAVELRIYDRVARIMDQRAKLLGLDGPIRIDIARAEAMRLASEYDLDPEELLGMAADIAAGSRI